MRRMWMLYLTLGLAATQGCHKTLRHTGGACDCYPPPVESLLVAPCPSNGVEVVGNVVGSYAPAPRATVTGNPATSNPVNGAAAMPAGEPIRALPAVLNPKP